MNCKDCKWNIGDKDYKEGVFIDCVWRASDEEAFPPCSSEAELCR